MIILILALIPISLSAQSPMNDFFEDHSGAQGYQTIIYGKRMLDMMKDGASPDVKSLLNRISSIRIISTKKPELNFFWVTFALNAVVAAISFFVYAETDASGHLIYNYKPVCLCILYCFISSFVGILGGSFVIEQIFAIPGVGQLYLQSITLFDYDVFMADTIFYVLIGLLAGIVVDISYGFIDPRIRMGEK